MLAWKSTCCNIMCEEFIDFVCSSTTASAASSTSLHIYTSFLNATAMQSPPFKNTSIIDGGSDPCGVGGKGRRSLVYILYNWKYGNCTGVWPVYTCAISTHWGSNCCMKLAKWHYKKNSLQSQWNISLKWSRMFTPVHHPPNERAAGCWWWTI